MTKLILPGDPGWNQPTGVAEKKPEVPKLSDEALERVFQEVVDEVKAKMDVSPEEVPAPTPEAPKEPPAPTASYKFHRPARKKSFTISMPQPITATLLEDLPRSWERKCYDTARFRKGDEITLTEMVFFPGVGTLYTFKEGSRGGYGVKPDQVEFSLPKPVDEVAKDIVDVPGQDTQVQ